MQTFSMLCVFKCDDHTDDDDDHNDNDHGKHWPSLNGRQDEEKNLCLVLKILYSTCFINK